MLESAVTALAVIGLVGVIHGASSATTHQAAAANSLNAQAPRFAVPSAARTAPPGAKPSPTPAATRPAATLMPASPASAGCQPLSDEGTCYEPGEFCSDSDHGATGVAGDGEQIVCQDNDGWRWEPVTASESAPDKTASDPAPSAAPSPTPPPSPSPTPTPTPTPTATLAPASRQAAA
jgi:hypothetical protein